MNDRFRFRAWNTEANKMYYSTYTEPLVIGGDEHWAIKGFADDMDSVLMQSTGLKDKNGKLIFEGDIFVDEIGRKMVVKYEEGMWTEEGYMTGYNFDFSIHDNCVVIGNIYENPEIVVSK